MKTLPILWTNLNLSPCQWLPSLHGSFTPNWKRCSLRNPIPIHPLLPIFLPVSTPDTIHHSSFWLSEYLRAWLSGSDPLPINFVSDKCLWTSWFPRLRFCGRCRNLEITVTIACWRSRVASCVSRQINYKWACTLWEDETRRLHPNILRARQRQWCRWHLITIAPSGLAQGAGSLLFVTQSDTLTKQYSAVLTYKRAEQDLVVSTKRARAWYCGIPASKMASLKCSDIWAIKYIAVV